MKKGTLFVVSGPSGCGKGTILAEILKNPNIYYSVSATTRGMRGRWRQLPFLYQRAV